MTDSPVAAAGIDTPTGTDAAQPSKTPRTRRSLLAGAAGALGGLLGSRLAAPPSVAAANGDSLRLGQSNSATLTTQLHGPTSGAALDVSTGAASALYGHASATTGQGTGVVGISSGDAGYGVRGTSANGSVGVHGWSYTVAGDLTIPAVPKKVGVYGFAVSDAAAIGVLGETKSGLGLKGKATTGSGVYGTTQSGYGVVGFSSTGTGGVFQTSSAMTGVALRTVGRVKFDNSVGRATIAAGTSSVVVTPGIDLTTTAAAVATLQGSAGGALVERVAIDTTANTLTIWLTKNTTVSVVVAWHVFG